MNVRNIADCSFMLLWMHFSTSPTLLVGVRGVQNGEEIQVYIEEGIMIINEINTAYDQPNTQSKSISISVWRRLYLLLDFICRWVSWWKSIIREDTPNLELEVRISFPDSYIASNLVLPTIHEVYDEKWSQ